MTLEGVILSFSGLLLLMAAFFFYHYYHFRFVSFVRNEHTPDMDPGSIEGYTDKYYYLPGERIAFYLYSEYDSNSVSLRRMKSPYEFEDVISKEFPKVLQARKHDASENGCGWEKTFEISLSENMKPGYYQAYLKAEDGSNQEYNIYFIIGSHERAEIMIVAPVSTWNAYNPYGGKSLYQNTFEAKTVYNVSMQRPNNAFQLNHDIHVEANAFNWFSERYKSVNIIPDYYLEDRKGSWIGAKMIVPVYHCEYISRTIYDYTLEFLNRGGSLISFGANQYYWIVRWNKDHTIMECRKDLTFFKGSFEYGGMWKHHRRHPNSLFGEAYTGSGMHTFAPYKVTNASHWLFEGTNVKNGDLFGAHGINELGISGAETDKANRSQELEIIAHGMNCDSEETGKNYDESDPRWNGEGGGDILLKRLSKENAVLALGSIQSPSGLGKDKVFTAIIENFMNKFITRD